MPDAGQRHNSSYVDEYSSAVTYANFAVIEEEVLLCIDVDDNLFATSFY